MRVIFDPMAEAQLEALHTYIARASGYEARADGYIARIVRFCQTLETFPERGTLYPHLRPGLRLIGFERRVTVAFMVHHASVIILGIFYGGQDVEGFFEDSQS